MDMPIIAGIRLTMTGYKLLKTNQVLRMFSIHQIFKVLSKCRAIQKFSHQLFQLQNSQQPNLKQKLIRHF